LILKEITICQSQLNKHQETHGVFTIEVANLETLLSGLHIKNGDLLRTSKNRNYEQSKHHYRQAIQILTGLIDKAKLNQKPTLIVTLQTVQVGAYLGLGCLLRNRNQDREAMEHLEKALDLTKGLITSEGSSPGQKRLHPLRTPHHTQGRTRGKETLKANEIQAPITSWGCLPTKQT